MRAFLIAVLGACVPGGGPLAHPPAPAPIATVRPPARVPAAASSVAPRDPITTLGAPRVAASWIRIGPAQRVLGEQPYEPIDEQAGDLEVDVLEERGGEIRVGVRLAHARFAIWVARAHRLGVIAHATHVGDLAGSAPAHGRDPIAVALREGARVEIVARLDGHSRVRYSGIVEVDGWVQDDALTTRGPAGRVTRGGHPGRRSMMFTPGTAIAMDRRFGARTLAVLRYSHHVELVQDLRDDWYEVRYVDSDVEIHGYASRRAPPSPVHRRRHAEPVNPGAPLVTNLTVPTDVCLFAGGEPVGFTSAPAPALVEPSPRVGWFTVTLDTPWGAIPFDARGAIETDLYTCERALR